MALFGKKSDAPAAPKPAKVAKAKKGFGKKKGEAGALDADELAALTGHADDTAVVDAPPPSAPVPPRRRKLMKNGVMLGLNIGQHSIKAVEVTVKNGALSITGAGEIPTPSDSIANGVVMNTTALAGAIKELLKLARIKSRKVVSSVSGTGSLVVRVIEVPRMTDKELIENMSQDAERYIPFPPSEVIMDFKALRELPSDPDAPNMEVLLAAAQSEVVDAHISVIGAAKLDPRAVDVEPLAAARAVADLTATLSEEGYVDYFDVSAVINLGATATEISVLRGDLLVFTRSVPKGGNDFTQTLIDHLALPWHDAERLKLEMADALPPQSAPAGGAVGVASNDDWSDFGVMGGDAQTAPDAAPNDFDNFDTQFAAYDEEPVGNNEAAPPISTPSATAPRTSDPFDPDFYEQGPQNREPGEQHGQKENEPFNFDFSNFGGDGDEKADEAVADEAVADAQTSGAVAPATPAASAFNFSFDDSAPVAPPASATLPASAAPVAPTIADEEKSLADKKPAANFSFDSPEEAQSWVGTSPAEETPDATSTTAATQPASTLDLPDFDILVAQPDDEDDEAVVQSATSESAYDLSDFSDIKPAATKPAVSATDAATDIAADEDDFDLDALFGSDTSESDFAAFDTGAAAGAPAGAATAAAGMGATATAPADDFGFSDLGGFENFGAGLAGAGDTPMIGIDADTVYSILAPQLEELITEVRRSLEYHASRYPDAAVRRIVLIGGGARMKNLDAYFTQELGIPVGLGNPLARLPLRTAQVSPEFIDASGPALAVALGLALRDMI